MHGSEWHNHFLTQVKQAGRYKRSTILQQDTEADLNGSKYSQGKILPLSFPINSSLHSVTAIYSHQLSTQNKHHLLKY